MTYARDPYDTDQPPCFCPIGSPHPRTTEEFCPAHGDPAKPAREPRTYSGADEAFAAYLDDHFNAPDPDAPLHFPGCHPEDGEDPRPSKPATEIQDTENCWHCGTPASRGCNCAECWDASDYIPPAAIYHCPLCKRWWAYMTGLDITEITFGAKPDEDPPVSTERQT